MNDIVQAHTLAGRSVPLADQSQRKSVPAQKKKFSKMPYKEGAITGLIITVIVAVLSPLTQWLTATVITPGYFPAIIEYTVSQGEMTPAAAEEYFSLSSYIWMSVVGALGMGVVTTLVVAAFTRKQS